MVYTLLSKVGDLLKDPRAVEVVERYVPGISKNPLVLRNQPKEINAQTKHQDQPPDMKHPSGSFC